LINLGPLGLAQTLGYFGYVSFDIYAKYGASRAFSASAELLVNVKDKIRNGRNRIGSTRISLSIVSVTEGGRFFLLVCTTGVYRVCNVR